MQANRALKGGSLGLVVMGDDSCSRGRGFESRRCILDGIFPHTNCCKKTKKRPRLAHLKKISCEVYFRLISCTVNHSTEE